MTQPAGPDDEHLGEMLDGHVITQIIASAVRFGLPDLLAHGPVSGGRLSSLTGIGLPELRRFMRALVGLGLVTTTDAGNYQGTPLARHLLRDSGRLHGHALMSGQQYYEAWSELDSVLRTGKSAYELRHGRDLWSTLCDDEDLTASFTRTMRWNMERTLAEILDLYRFPGTGIIADLGAGDGTLSAGLLRRYPGLRAIVFDRPAVIRQSRRAMRVRGLADRCEFIGGSFLETVPPGADLYLLKSVIHNWDDATAVRILRNCRDAMRPDNRLVLIERARFDGDPLKVAVRDLAMLVLFGSHDRAAEEYGELMTRAGLRVTRTATGPSGICVLEAAPAAGGQEGPAGGGVLVATGAPVDAAAEELARGEAGQPETLPAEVGLVGVANVDRKSRLPSAPR